MDEPVAVVTPFPVLRRGLFAALSGAAFAPEEPDDPLAWVGVDGHRAVLLAVDKRQDAQLVVDLRRGREDLVVVALLLEPTPETVRGVLLAGACSVAGWDASPEEVVALLEAGLEARSVLPTSMMHQLAMGATDEPGVPDLDRDQVAWLRALAAGATVAQLADRVGYSEREMYRLLRAVYDRLGVGSRTQALLWATRRGILD
ncbi:MAG: hypothetical protein OEM81_07755 [Acidimicrobiia bacterium]|nr:hypothetical protein [Acidimicrobiia bacterium]MDH3397708.1 hypothetical protein [Acidimicrobiia bacterium]